MSSASAKAINREKVVIEVPEGTESIGTEYRDNKTVTEIILPPCLKHIGDNAFEGCTNLEKINFPDRLASIGSMAFLNCVSLSVPPLPDSLEDIGDGAFAGCLKVKQFKSISKNGRYFVRKGCIYNTDNELVQYPAGCAHFMGEVSPGTVGIRDYAFYGSMTLQEFYFREEVAHVSAKSFLGCPNLRAIWVPEENRSFSFDERALLNKDGTELIYLTPGTRGKEYAISDVERVGPYSLAGCEALKHLYITENLEYFDPEALGDSVKLRRLSVNTEVECKLPFVMKDENGKVLTSEEICGYEYRLGKKGEFIRDKPFERMKGELSFDDDDDIFGFPGGGNKFNPVNVKGCSFDDVIGLDDVKLAVRRHLILPSEHPELFKQFKLETGTGVLMYGPPGTGKTLMARAVASELDAKFFSVKPSDIYDCWVGSEEKNVRNLFKEARKHKKSVIFFDDFDAIGIKRGTGYMWNNTLVTEILTQMQGLEKYDGTLLVIAATNRPWVLDTALTRSGRFGIHLTVGLPSYEARVDMFRRKLTDIPLDDIDYEDVARRTEGYNGADIEEVCKTAKAHRVEAIMDGGSPNLCMDDLNYALDYVKPTVSRKDLEDIEWFSNNGTDPAERDTYKPSSNSSSVPGYS